MKDRPLYFPQISIYLSTWSITFKCAEYIWLSTIVRLRVGDCRMEKRSLKLGFLRRPSLPSTCSSFGPSTWSDSICTVQIRSSIDPEAFDQHLGSTRGRWIPEPYMRRSKSREFATLTMKGEAEVTPEELNCPNSSSLSSELSCDDWLLDMAGFIDNYPKKLQEKF